jgi:hypothetical protein
VTPPQQADFLWLSSVCRWKGVIVHLSSVRPAGPARHPLESPFVMVELALRMSAALEDHGRRNGRYPATWLTLLVDCMISWVEATSIGLFAKACDPARLPPRIPPNAPEAPRPFPLRPGVSSSSFRNEEPCRKIRVWGRLTLLCAVAPRPSQRLGARLIVPRRQGFGKRYSLRSYSRPLRRSNRRERPVLREAIGQPFIAHRRTAHPKDDMKASSNIIMA